MHARDVRFTPESGHFQMARRCPLSAKSGHPGAFAEPRILASLGYRSPHPSEIYFPRPRQTNVLTGPFSFRFSALALSCARSLVRVLRKRALVRGKDLAPIICHMPLGERALLHEGTGEVAPAKIGPDRCVSIATLRHSRRACCHTSFIPPFVLSR